MKTKSLIYLILSLLFAAVAISYSSCKKEEVKPASTEPVVSDETIIAEDNGLENPTISGNTYTYDYSGSAPDVSVGEVIVGQTGEGYMRKVTGITYKNNQVILETEQARLTDVIDNCDISDSIVLNLGQKSATLNGSPINVEITGLKEGMVVQEDLVNLTNVILFSGEVNGVTLEAKITEGYIAFEPVIHRKLKIKGINGKPTVTEFLLTAEGQLDLVCNVLVSCDGNLSYTPELDPLLTFKIGPIFFGPVPAFIKFSFTPGFESAFIINGNLTKGYQANATVEFGAQYLLDEGWQKITDKSFTFNEDPLQWSLNGNLHAKTWVTPQIDLRLAGVLGPYMNVNPFLAFDGQVNLPQWQWALSGGVDGYLGFDMSLFGWQIVNYKTSIFDWQVIIAEQSGMQAGLPVVGTKAISEITASSAKCGGNISSDGGAAVTARGVCWSTSQNPTTANSHTTDGNGTGQFTSSITGLNGNTNYFVRAYATNGEGTAYGNQVQFTTQGSGGSGEPCPGMETITYGGQVYNTVLIGDQCWLKENLNIGTMIPGADEMQNNGTIEKYCYDDDPANCDIYGGLYQWDEMMQYSTLEGVQGICPAGWHLPADAEWTILADYLGGEDVAGGKMKETGTTHWHSPNKGATNSSGFTALPGGIRFRNFFSSPGGHGLWWSSSEVSSTDRADARELGFDYEDLADAGSPTKELGFSVRCLRD